MQTPEQIAAYNDAAALLINIIFFSGVFCTCFLIAEAFIEMKRRNKYRR